MTTTTTTPNWLELPRDLTANILQRLGAVDILTNVRNVCPYWWNICKDPSIWREIHMGNFQFYFESSNRVTPDLDDRLVKMCQYAVDLSSGHLEKIHIYRFGTDNLLRYIADRASHLRCIQLECCVRISDEGWCEVAKKFPLLEEVGISHGFQCKKSLEVIGQSCPLLKSLTLYGMPLGAMWNDDAFVIANTMPGLRHLDIRGNRLTNVGLLAILDGCPLLESLNIEGCDNLDITESLRQRLNSQIKDLLILEGCPDSYNNVQLEFAYEDSSDSSYLEYVEKFDDDDKEEEEEE
ncbi:F-box protein skip19, partial [Trifolium pratense]